jgi:drug/metabolite transporter (DMT)-like permease
MRDWTRADQTTLVAFLLTVGLAGGNAVAIDVVSAELDAYWAAGTRFVAAGFVFAVLMILLRIGLPTGRALVGAVIYGVIGFGAAFGLAFVAIPMTGAGTGQLLLSLVPLLTLVLSPLHRLEAFRVRAALGSLIALAGVAILTVDRLNLEVPPAGIGLDILAAVCFAEAGIVVKLTPRAHPVATNAIAMLTGSALLFPLSLLVGEAWRLPSGQDTWVAVSYLVLLGSVGVFWLYVFVIGRWSASTVSFEFLLIPLITIPASAVLTGEAITLIMVAGAALILLGVYFGALARPTVPSARAVETG